MLTIYKASAGSGKTFRLVTEYLKLVFTNEFNYRHILAVTFTNKATAEMKERVINQLFTISSNPEKSPYAGIISKETGLSTEEMKKKAAKALRNILHDFNRFSVSTIDKFTHKVIKAFNRELGITPAYALELDNDIIIQEATDRLILKASSDKKLKKWLTLLGNERLSEKKSFVIRDGIISLGQELFKEIFQDCFATNKGFYSRKNLKSYRKKLLEIIGEFEAVMKAKGDKGLEIISENNLSVDDFSFGNAGVISIFKKICEKQFIFGTRITEAVNSSEKWVKKDHKRRSEILVLVENKLLPLLGEILDYYETYYPNYVTSQIIATNLYTLGLLNDLQLEIEALFREKGILLLSDSNLLLKKIIAGSDSPFIYEKTGNTFHHYMLDEFQDTSALQWENFKPLIDNSLADGKNNLVVGDVKQSIYRWRNGDWNILANKIASQFDQRQVQVFDLQQNWRSDSNIIRFNNLLFPEFVSQLAQKCDTDRGVQPGEISITTNLFNKIYSGIEQQTGKEKERQKGFVKINFIEETEESGYKELSLGKLLTQVKELLDCGFTGRDIAILVRRNKEGTDIIRYFLDAAGKPENQAYNLEIISNESLFLNASNGVIFVVQLINHFINPEDKITKANILNEYNIYIRPALQKKGMEFIPSPGIVPGKEELNPIFHSATEQARQLDGLFEQEFEATFGQVILTLKKEILSASVDEIITSICKTFNLFELEPDLPFLQGLIDQAAQVKSSLTNDLSGFLKWWDEKGYKLSVNVNDDTDAIRLLTIHKSKGLEFKAVLIPFFDWQVSWNFTPLIWCEPMQEPFKMVPLVPVLGTVKMADSLFSEEYYTEVFNTYVDNLNLVYVAFTRAISVLFINAPLNTKENTKKLKINQFLYDSVSILIKSGPEDGLLDQTEQIYQLGELSKITFENGITKENIILHEFSFNEFNSKLKLRSQSDDFFAEPGLSQKNLGILVHEILSQVETIEDIEKACLRALYQQKIKSGEYPALLNWLQKLVGSAQAKSWFSGDYKILNERNLLSVEGIHRPDRVMIKDGEAVVVDYKLGQTGREEYICQVESYAAELKKTGYTEVTGYLWFVGQNRIEKICQL